MSPLHDLSISSHRLILALPGMWVYLQCALMIKSIWLKGNLWKNTPLIYYSGKLFILLFIGLLLFVFCIYYVYSNILGLTFGPWCNIKVGHYFKFSYFIIEVLWSLLITLCLVDQEFLVVMASQPPGHITKWFLSVPSTRTFGLTNPFTKMCFQYTTMHSRTIFFVFSFLENNTSSNKSTLYCNKMFVDRKSYRMNITLPRFLGITFIFI